VHHARVGGLEVVRQVRHPRHVVGVARAELRARDLLAVAQDAAHVLALVVAHDRDRARSLAEEVDDRARLGAAIDQITDADHDLVVANAGHREQPRAARGSTHGCHR
jgi:hypothetical protein